MVKKGDTLIEVTLAVGIFSMIAIAVVAVMNASTSNAQTALETTLAREEIDAQAEALRFIHSAYTNDGAEDSKYKLLWQEIAKLGNANEAKADITQFSPDTCARLYQSKYLENQHAFILNINKLATFTAKNISSVLIDASKKPNSFKEAKTAYPRIFYSGSTDTLVSEDYNAALSRAEGIYIVPVKDQSKTAIFIDGKRVDTQPAFYDFYIRTCWYGSNSDTPSTISTLIRLYNPAITK